MRIIRSPWKMTKQPNALTKSSLLIEYVTGP